MAAGHPKFSVVVPTYGRPGRLAACLNALAALDYPRDAFEVIVADDGSPKPIDDVAAAVGDSLDLTVLRLPHGGAGAARNRAVEVARGRFLAFTDDDCAVARDWLTCLEARLARTNDGLMVGGKTRNALVDNVYSTASQMVVDVGYAHLNADPENAAFFTASNMALPREQFVEIGGFDTRFVASEDRELCARWSERGLRMVYAREVRVDHFHDLDAWSFLRQHFVYGRGAWQMQRVRAERNWRQFRPDPGYYGRLLRHPFHEQDATRALALSSLLLTSVFATLAGILVESLRPRGMRLPHGEQA